MDTTSLARNTSLASSRTQHAASFGNKITILSIDGGGVRGIIPGIMLNVLEEELQKQAGDPDARLADFFDVIAGTSTGGLLTALLTAPNEHDRPLLAAKDITEFYTKECPHIFPDRNGMFAPLMNAFTAVFGPRYDGKYLHQLIKKKLTNKDGNQIQLNKTLTNVVIPAFDIKTLEPVIFSNLEVDDSPRLDCNLSDICIGTSAAPTYLPAHYFKNEHFHGEKPDDNEFNLIDGGVCANNPTLIAMSVVTKKIFKKNQKFTKEVSGDHRRFLVLSLGTGTSSQAAAKYNAKMASKWGIFGWLIHHFSTPLVDVFTQASADLVDFHLSPVFQALAESNDNLETTSNYLRIQDTTLTDKVASTDVSSKENLQHLVDAGNNLLTKPVMRVDMETGKPKPNMKVTNKAALKEFAEKLWTEHQFRKTNYENSLKEAGSSK